MLTLKLDEKNPILSLEEGSFLLDAIEGMLGGNTEGIPNEAIAGICMQLRAVSILIGEYVVLRHMRDTDDTNNTSEAPILTEPKHDRRGAA